MHVPFGLFEAECKVRRLAVGVPELSIRGDFPMTALSCPVLSAARTSARPMPPRRASGITNQPSMKGTGLELQPSAYGRSESSIMPSARPASSSQSKTAMRQPPSRKNASASARNSSADSSGQSRERIATHASRSSPSTDRMFTLKS
jgi:hypothetical protein